MNRKKYFHEYYIKHRDEIMKRNKEYYINNRNRIIERIRRNKNMNDQLGSSGTDAIYKAKSIEELIKAIEKEKRRIQKSSKKYDDNNDNHYNSAYSDDYSSYIYFDNDVNEKDIR